jgi:hypothetical protein
MPDFRGAIRGDSSESRGYGTSHRKQRAIAFKKLPEYSPCCRCKKPMWKHAKNDRGVSALHFDHNDQRNGYLGFSHESCNVKAGASKGAQVANARRKGRQAAQAPAKPWSSRSW